MSRTYFTRSFYGFSVPQGGQGSLFPTFVSLLQTLNVTNSNSTQAFTYTGATIPAGNTLVMLFGVGTSSDVTGWKDNIGNTWNVDISKTDGFNVASVSHTYLNSPLISGSIITGYVSGTNFATRGYYLVNLSNCASGGQPDAMTGRTVFAMPVNESANTDAATVGIGLTLTDNALASYTGSNWNLLATTGEGIGSRIFFPYYVQSGASGVLNPRGAYTGAAVTQINAWAAYK